MRSFLNGVGFVLFAATSGVLGCDSGPSAVTGVVVASPSGKVQLSVTTDGEGRMTYTVTRDGVTMLEASPLGLISTAHDLTAGVTMTEGAIRAIDESYTMLVGKRRDRDIAGNEITIPLQDRSGARAELISRAQEDGVAFRYRLLGEGMAQVMDETTGFMIPSGARALLRPYDSADVLLPVTIGAYEQPSEILALGEPTDATGFAFPALFEIEEGKSYLMISEADLDDSYCGTRLHEMPEGSLYRIRFPDPREGKGIGEVLPSSQLPYSTPWRVIAIGGLATIVESTIVDDLSRPPVDGSADWVRPGRAAWSWPTQLTGSPALQSEYIDFAGEHGWDYVLIDAKWDQWEAAEQEVQNLAAHAATVGVKLLLWYNSGGPHTTSPGETPINRMSDPEVRRAEMEKIAGWGIAGIKLDFFNSDKQDRIAQYIDILEDAQAYQLLVNFHGSTVPRGWQRTYPHLMAHEAINGAEYYGMPGDRSPTAIMNVQSVLLRNVVGSMDYTPVAFERALAATALPYVHSLALSVLFESGIQHFAGRADSNTELGYRAVFAAYPYVGEFLSTVPVAWDDTRLIDGDIDGRVVVARRKGMTWYLAGIHAADSPIEFTLALDFLGAGTFDLELIEQGETPDSFERSTRSVVSDAPLAVTLRPNGGFVATFTPLTTMTTQGAE
ncbi:MAG: glycoside hydrolase family 97 catalytic domain-containing protein [Polyangiales bacterium]